MRPARARILLLMGLAMAGCGVQPQLVAGSEDTVSFSAGPLANVNGYAQRYCRRYGKRAVFLGDRPLGPSTTKRLYGYNCISPADPRR